MGRIPPVPWGTVAEPRSQQYDGVVAEEAMPLLVIHDPDTGERREVEFDEDSLVVGRSAKAAVRIRHKAVSKFHAAIRRNPGGYSLVDLDSSNGIRLNRVRVKEAPLKNGDRILLGIVPVTFFSSRDEMLAGEKAGTAARRPPVARPVRGPRAGKGARRPSTVTGGPPRATGDGQAPLERAAVAESGRPIASPPRHRPTTRTRPGRQTTVRRSRRTGSSRPGREELVRRYHYRRMVIGLVGFIALLVLIAILLFLVFNQGPDTSPGNPIE